MVQVRMGRLYTNLANELFVNCRIMLGADCLLQKRKQDGDNYAGLKTFSKADEEHFEASQ